MSWWIWMIIGFVLGTLVSGVLFFLSIDKFWVGNLREDRSIPEEPYYFMEIGQGRFERLSRNNFALLRIIRQNYTEENSK